MAWSSYIDWSSVIGSVEALLGHGIAYCITLVLGDWHAGLH
jgi:hypothetical protein